MFGHQTQVALLAPMRVKMSCTWRQAVTYSPGLLPLTSSFQGNQKPFISQSKRRKKGCPHSRAFSAKLSMNPSYLPPVIAASRKFGWRTSSCSVEEEDQLRKGMAPCS